MKQQGVALVSVLLVVAIATVMAVTMMREQQASIQSTRGFLSRGQATQYALGGEELARQILFEDFKEGTGRDHLAETWADPELHFEFEEGEVNLVITDLQGLINLNGAIEGSASSGTTRQRLLNLFAATSIDPMLLDRLLDWLDADTSNRPTGAEDFDYLALDPPYRAGNGPLVSTSEIILLGLPADQYLVIQPLLTVLPSNDTSLNINTAPPAVLQTLSPALPVESATILAVNRNEQAGYETVEAFLQAPELAGLGVSADGLGVQSSFFEVRVIARYQDRFSYLTSLVYRSTTDGSIQVLARSFARNVRPELSGAEEDA